jgi:methylated-DNA-protein-cysteine methyltransferase-like protein
MQERLEAEGIKIIEDEIQNFKTHFWNPDELEKF